MREISGQIVDVLHETVAAGTITVVAGRIAEIRHHPVAERRLIMPGLIDAHVHIESSLLSPAEFARVAATHGTVAAVSDPHEIANVLGEPGIDFMLENGNQSLFHFFFGVAGCRTTLTGQYSVILYYFIAEFRPNNCFSDGEMAVFSAMTQDGRP